jgi:RNA polymerase sigma factor for flagellar operon FliA
MTATYDAVATVDRPLDELVVEHADLVKRIAYHVISRMPPHVEVEDLIQAGMIGLMNAAQNYSPDKGANFETYAGIRIRGSMLDEARKANWTPRSTVRQSKQISLVVREIENRTGRDARGPEVAEALGMDLDEYYRVLESAVSTRLLSFDQLSDDPERVQMLPESPGLTPDGSCEADAFREALAGAIGGLPEREQLVLSLYYDDEMNLREIGDVLGVSESRVCQIHGQAVVRIRARLGNWVDDDE